MSRQVLYVAAPLRPTVEEVKATTETIAPPVSTQVRVDAALRANLDRAMRWLSWLRRSFPETTFIAPWIASVLAGDDDTDPARRAAGLIDDCTVIERCDGIVLCGGRISDGMRREMEHGELRVHVGYAPFKIYDLVSTSNRGICDKSEPPTDLYQRGEGDFLLAGSWSTPVLSEMERIWRMSR